MVRFWDRSMWQPACAWHHDVIKQKLERLWRQGGIKLTDLWLNSDLAQKFSRDE
jgi:hypothetical protein